MILLHFRIKNCCCLWCPLKAKKYSASYGTSLAKSYICECLKCRKPKTSFGSSNYLLVFILQIPNPINKNLSLSPVLSTGTVWYHNPFNSITLQMLTCTSEFKLTPLIITNKKKINTRWDFKNYSNTFSISNNANLKGSIQGNEKQNPSLFSNYRQMDGRSRPATTN